MGILGKRQRPSDRDLARFPAAVPVDVSAHEDSIYGRADALQAALRSISRLEDVGQPFGPGFGLETVADWVRQILPDPLEYHPVGARAADAIIGGVRNSTISLNDYDTVLGIDEDSWRKYGLSRRQAFSNLDAINESKDLMAGMSTHDFDRMRRWFDDEAFAFRMVAYFQLGMLRLMVAGKKLSY